MTDSCKGKPNFCKVCGKTFYWYAYLIAHQAHIHQEPLGEKFEKVLHDNLFDLYDSGDSDEQA